VSALEPPPLAVARRDGRIALWAHVETDAYFGTLTVTAS